jgi:hypothetical protein
MSPTPRPTCPVCRQVVTLTPGRAQVKAHDDPTGGRCLGTGAQPQLSGLAWWQRLRFSRWGKPIVGAIGVAAAMAGVLTYFHIEPSNSNPGSAIIDTAGMSVAATNTTYRLVVPIQNPTPLDDVVSSLSVLTSFPAPPCAEVPYGLVYKIASKVKIDAKKRSQGSVSAASGPASGFAVPFTGLLGYGCSWDQLQFSFVPPAATLTHSSTTTIVVDLPRKLQITKANDPSFLADDVTLPNINDETKTQFLAFSITLTTPKGHTIHSCYLLADSTSTTKTGLQNCGLKINGRDVFSSDKLDVNKPRV